MQLLSFATGKTDVLFVDREREVPMPLGKFIAVGLISPGKFLGITSTLQIQRGQKTLVSSFARPAPGRSNLLVRGEYVGGSASDPRDVSLALSSQSEKFKPASSTNAASGSHYSVFYEIPQGLKRIEVTSKEWRGTQIEVTLGESFVFKDDLVFVPKPSLTVRPVDATGNRTAQWKAKIYSCKESEFGAGSAAWPSLETCLTDRALEGSGSELVISGLDAKWYFVVVELAGRRVGKQVDLRSGQDRTEQFDFKRRRVFGVVREGDRGVAAEMTFENYDTGEHADDVTSGSDGTYEEFLWQSGMYRVEIRSQENGEAQAAVYQLPVGEEESVRRDFTIPSGRVTVTVMKESTQDPIRGASLGFLLGGASEERQTDELGTATLPPLPPGKLRLIAQADGYERKDETREVVDTKATQHWNVFLKPLDDGHSFSAILPNGVPAASATVLWRLDANGAFLFRQECDSTGTCRFAERPPDGETLFLVDRHAGLTVVSAGTAFHDREVRLLPRGGALTFSVRRGEESLGAVLSASVMVGGAVVPPFALETIANLVGEPFRLYLHPGAVQSILIAGLPAGTSISVIVSSAGSVSGPQQPISSTQLSLPLAGAVEVTAP